MSQPVSLAGVNLHSLTAKAAEGRSSKVMYEVHGMAVEQER